MNKLMTIHDVETSRYTAVNASKPKGYNCWKFHLYLQSNSRDFCMTPFTYWTTCMTYAQARKEAIARANEIGAQRIVTIS